MTSYKKILLSMGWLRDPNLSRQAIKALFFSACIPRCNCQCVVRLFLTFFFKKGDNKGNHFPCRENRANGKLSIYPRGPNRESEGGHSISDPKSVFPRKPLLKDAWINAEDMWGSIILFQHHLLLQNSYRYRLFFAARVGYPLTVGCLHGWARKRRSWGWDEGWWGWRGGDCEQWGSQGRNQDEET